MSSPGTTSGVSSLSLYATLPTGLTHEAGCRASVADPLRLASDRWAVGVAILTLRPRLGPFLLVERS